MNKYYSYTAILNNGRKTKAHQTYQGAIKEAEEIIKREEANGYYVNQSSVPGVSWRVLPE